MTPLVHLPPDCSHEAVCESLDQDAAVVIDGLLDEAALEAVDRELSPFFETARRGTNDFSGFETQRLGALMARSATCRDMALDRLVNGACRQYLLRHADGYQLHFTQAVRIGPGEGAQPLHRDRGVWGERVPRRIETQLSTVWAISGFTRANGATRVVPGSHRWEKERQPEEHEVVDAEMEPGSVLVYSGTVLHGGGNNTSDSHRLGVLLHYTLDWLRQEENQYLSCPPEIAKDLPRELRALMGYSRANEILGFYSSPVGPGVDAHELADPERMFSPARKE